MIAQCAQPYFHCLYDGVCPSRASLYSYKGFKVVLSFHIKAPCVCAIADDSFESAFGLTVVPSLFNVFIYIVDFGVNVMVILQLARPGWNVTSNRLGKVVS